MKFGRVKEDREPLPIFLLKGTLFVALLYLMGSLFFSRFSIAVDPQVVRCIPAYSIYLLDHKDVEPKRDALYAFTSKDLSPIYEAGTKMLKVMKGLPGDVVEIEGDTVNVNGKPVAFGLSLAEEKLGLKKESFSGKNTLGADQYWLFGTSHLSFDSRYWGGVKSEQIYARAYPLL